MIDALEDARATMLPTFAIEDQAEKEAARAALLAPDGKMTAVLLKVSVGVSACMSLCVSAIAMTMIGAAC